MTSTFGERLSNLRKSTGLSQEELSHHIHISRASLSHYESDRRFPKKVILDRILTYFGPTSQMFLFGESKDTLNDLLISYASLSSENQKKVMDYVCQLSIKVHT